MEKRKKRKKILFRSLKHPNHEFFDPLYKFLRTKKKHVIIVLALLVFMIKFKDVFLLLFLGAIVTGIDYVMHITRFHLHLELTFLIGFIVTQAYGFSTGLIFILVTGNLAEVLTVSFDIKDILSSIPILLFCYIGSLLPGNLMFLGVIFSVALGITQFLIARFLGEPIHSQILEPLIGGGINIILFINYGQYLYKLMVL